MNFLNLEYFLVVARELNVTKAASILNLSQQSLSRHILAMEKELDVALFDRGARLTLTEAGRCFVENAARILDLRAQTLVQIQDIKDHRNNIIRIGITHARSQFYLPCFLPELYQLFPEAQVLLLEKPSEDIFSDLLEGKADVAVGVEPQDKVNFTSYSLHVEDYAMLVPVRVLSEYFSEEEIRFFGEYPKRISLERFRECPFLCFDTTRRIGRIFKSMCLNAGFEPNIILESTSISTLINLCVRGLGITICPSVYVELSKMHSDILQAVHIYPVPDSSLQTNISVILPRNRYASILTREFIRIAKEEFSDPEYGTLTERWSRLPGRPTGAF